VRLAVATAALVGLVAASDGTAASTRTETLHHRERALVRQVEQAKTTLRWFEHHARLLYSPVPRVKRRAWHDVNTARQRIILRRRDLRWTRGELARLAVPGIPHRAEWMCIHRGEGPWDDAGAPYYGGLQMDLEFQRDYGLDLLRSKGTADHWTPEEQMRVAERAYRTRGFWPWPNTAKRCGLL
jgi:hypothetical protein